MSLLRKKDLLTLQQSEQKSELKKTLGTFQLTMMGIGAIIGTGIFVLTGVVAAEKAGPAIMLSFVISAIVCMLAALCYAEFASTIPVSGSAYTYGYAVFGELPGWILGWALILEYGLACASVASGWSGYFQGLLADSKMHIHLPAAISNAFDPAHGHYIDLPAIVIICVLVLILSAGAKESATLNTFMVILKLAVVVLFIVLGFRHVDPANWHPFMPYHFSGVTAGAATVFFAYLGFDAVTTAAEEVKNPQKSLPIALITSLLVCSLLYLVVSAILTGIVPYTDLDVKNPVSFAFEYIGMKWAAGFISAGSIIGITTVLLVMLYGQIRLLYSIGRDGLLPRVFSQVSAKTQTPVKGGWISAAVISIFAGFIPLGHLVDLTNIGTFFAFIVVSAGILILRKKYPDLPRSFKVPFVPFTPILAILACGYLMTQLTLITWIGFIVWMVIGLALYFLYGYRHSLLNNKSN
ncbi:amino acid permease [Gorillibacterium massiliense]|uniref:amino acid permease n=1 Tax=Gorillibacterium massiliense TaxID=1280390 RepID=UPI0004BC6E07|nr:amino acid permease [Gorillibacterium massiliense]